MSKKTVCTEITVNADDVEANGKVKRVRRINFNCLPIILSCVLIACGVKACNYIGEKAEQEKIKTQKMKEALNEKKSAANSVLFSSAARRSR
jgi:hypothetical protein